MMGINIPVVDRADKCITYFGIILFLICFVILLFFPSSGQKNDTRVYSIIVGLVIASCLILWGYHSWHKEDGIKNKKNQAEVEGQILRNQAEAHKANLREKRIAERLVNPKQTSNESSENQSALQIMEKFYQNPINPATIKIRILKNQERIEKKDDPLDDSSRSLANEEMERLLQLLKIVQQMEKVKEKQDKANKEEEDKANKEMGI